MRCVPSTGTLSGNDLHLPRFRVIHCFALGLTLSAPLGALPAQARAPDPSELPLVHIGDFEYAGAFRLPSGTFGASSLNFSEGPFVYDTSSNSIFIVGHNHHQAIAQFFVPELVVSSDLEALEMADSPLQPFSTVLYRASGGNPEDLNRIGGLALVNGPAGPQLVVNAYEYYDAPADNTETTAVAREASDLSGSQIDGFFTLEGGAGHTSGWISSIPQEWQSILGGTHITGQSSGIPIIGRTSVGPSAFAFDAHLLTDDVVPNPVPTTRLLDFSLDHPLHEDLLNETGENDIWTHLSRVTYGFIAPQTRTYVTIGYSGGHVSGVCYRCTQENGNECGGYCAPDPDDYYQYYWLWDVNDLVAVRNGTLESYEVRPYEYGIFSTPFENGTAQIGGGSFDPASGLLYLSIQKADLEQGTYENPPVIVAYQVSLQPASVSPGATVVENGYRMSAPVPNPSRAATMLRFSVPREQQVSITVHDVTGRQVATVFDGTVEPNRETFIRVSRGHLPAGAYVVRAEGADFIATRRITWR